MIYYLCVQTCKQNATDRMKKAFTSEMHIFNSCETKTPSQFKSIMQGSRKKTHFHHLHPYQTHQS